MVVLQERLDGGTRKPGVEFYQHGALLRDRDDDLRVYNVNDEQNPDI